MTPRLKEKYRSEVVPALKEQLGLLNIHEVPGFEKIVVNMGVGQATQDAKILDAAIEDLSIITGQKPRMNRARKSIAAFKLREGTPVGIKVTLRGDRMWEFMDRVLTAAIPRMRDFRGLEPGSFDGRGNFTMGIDEQLIFPEIDYDKIQGIRGMDITFVTTGKTDEAGRALFDAFAFPFKR